MEGRIFSETENNFVFLIEAINVVVSNCERDILCLSYEREISIILNIS